MASISTCFRITPNFYSKHSSFFSLKPSRQFDFSRRSHNDDFHKQFLKLGKQHINSNGRSFVTEIRASSNAPTVEATPADVRKRAMDAVDKCGRRVTVGDVASKAGIKLIEAQKALQAIAADTNGFLEVSDEGDVLYVFPKDYRSKLAAKSLRIKTEPYLEKIKSGAEYLVRVAFGTTLIASIIIVFIAIFAILASISDSDKKDRKRSKGRSFSSGIFSDLRLSALFWSSNPYYNRRGQVQKEDIGMIFIEPVFSFVFGDGDPNKGIEEERWKMIGQFIGSNGGVVTAEELAPYLDVESAEKTVDDSYILPVLLRFDGQPQVDEEGNILYQFPSLQRTAASKISSRKENLAKKFSERVGGPDKFFKEKNWKLSKTSSTEKAMVGGFGGINLFGVIVLGGLLKTTTIEPNEFLSFVSAIFPLLQMYAFSFFAIPLIRWYIIQKTNTEIEKRNRARELRAQALELPDVSLKRKILSARKMSQKTVIGQDRIVYTTGKDVSEQDYDKQEWDRRFKDIKKSD